ncbi:MAG: hypothetical protein KAR23_05880 [Candidatus Aenigmarchaeota archaeon]|nr:hypothetical protein [Candidatus Aenigmarchaeota archaeon]
MVKNENKSTAGQEIKKIEDTLEKTLVSLNLFSPEILLLFLAIMAG